MAKGPAPTETMAPPFSGWERSIARRYLRTKRKNGGVALISGIAFVGIMLAVAVLIIVMSVMNGFRIELTDRMLGFNGHLYVSGPVNGVGREEVIKRLRQMPNVTQVAPVVEAQSIVMGPSQVVGAVVRGMRPGDVADTKIISTNMRQGSLEGFGQGEYGGDLILLGSRLAETVGVHVGDTVSLVSPSGASTAFGSSPRRKDYTVGGIFSVGLSDYDAAYIYMPLEQAQLFFGRESESDRIEVNFDNPERVYQQRAAIAQAVGPGGMVTDWRDTNKSFFNALQVERATMRLILLMVVAISVMNIISGLIMLVKNKTRDIAILRTMGASQGAILRIFFMSGAWIGTAGALAGLILGSLFCIFIDPIQSAVEAVTGVQVFSPDTYFLSRIPAKIDWLEVTVATGSAMLMSFVATLPTAWRASRIDPVEALRYE